VTEDRLRGVDAIRAHLATHGEAFTFDRHQVYRLSQRTDLPLPIDGPPGMPVATRSGLDAWVAAVRRRGNRTALGKLLTLFEQPE